MKQINNFTQKIKVFFDKTDIYTLVFIPPVIGFPIYIVYIVLVSRYITNYSLTECLSYFGSTVMFLFMCIGGVAEIYKKEMPWYRGRIYKGNLAVISGLIGVIVFGFLAIETFIHGVNILTKLMTSA